MPTQNIDGNMGQMPPMNEPANNGQEMGQMPLGDEGSDFQSDFDAGVDADAEADPKKYIQQLSGKLSQELRKYNQEQQQPDTELNKYVAGMIIPQASKGLTDKDKTEVINKLEKGNVDDIDVENNDGGDMDFSGGGEMPNETDNMPMESVKKKDINEIIDGLLDNEIRKRSEKKITNNKISNKNPFIANR